MPARLFCKTGQMAGTAFDIREEASIGKNPGNAIQLQPSIISGHHARIFYDKKAQCYVLEDLNSRNGTRLDGMRVRGKEKLGKLNIVTFANMFDFIFQSLPEGVAISSKKTGVTDKPTSQKSSSHTVMDDAPFVPPDLGEKATPVAAARADGSKTVLGDDILPLPKLGKSAPPRSGSETVIDENINLPPALGKPPVREDATRQVSSEVQLIFSNLKSGERTVTLKEGENTLGRASTSDIPVDDTSMSRAHAVIIVRSGKITVKDLGSKNGTLLNNEKVTVEREVSPNAALMFGLVKAKLIVIQK
ncbi:MAG TPA: FHA domain-containing protein [Bacteroidota bacterium]